MTCHPELRHTFLNSICISSLIFMTAAPAHADDTARLNQSS